jgi:hypothetical protein
MTMLAAALGLGHHPSLPMALGSIHFLDRDRDRRDRRDSVLPPATATATTITQQLGTVRAALQQVITDYAAVQLTQPERQRLNEGLVGIRAALNSLVNISNGSGR